MSALGCWQKARVSNPHLGVFGELLKMKRRRVLLVDEDEDSSRKTERALRFREWDVLRVKTLNEGLCAVGKETFDTVLVDSCGEEGLVVALSLYKRLQELGNFAPVVMVSKGGHPEELFALEAGVDDWIAKPSTPEIIEARLKIRLRPSSKARSLRVGEFSLDLEKLVGRLGDREISFTGNETKVLQLLMETPERVVSKAKLMERIYGAGYAATDHGLQRAVKGIRQKIEFDPKAPEYLQNVHGQGYRFRPPKTLPAIDGSSRGSRVAVRIEGELVVSD